MSENTREWLNYVDVLPVTRKWLIEKANKLGRRVEHQAGIELDDLASVEMLIEDDSGNVSNYEWFLEGQRRKRRARHAAAIYLNHPSDEAAQRLQKLCDDAGMNYEEVVAKADADPFSSIIAGQKTATLRGECAIWLMEVLTKHPEGIPATTIYQIARENGYSSSTLDRAKRDINQDQNTPGIGHDRTGGFSTWMLEE